LPIGVPVGGIFELIVQLVEDIHSRDEHIVKVARYRLVRVLKLVRTLDDDDQVPNERDEVDAFDCLRYPHMISAPRHR
jgi:hypothetical protein